MNALTLYRTLRHLRFRQILARLSFRMRRVDVGGISAPQSKMMPGTWVEPAPHNAKMLGKRNFRLLNQDIRIVEVNDWNLIGRDKLLLYHLHYMDVLTSVNARQCTEWHEDLIEQWIKDNPAPAGNGWEPYTISLRIVNWIKWELAGNSLSKRATQSLCLQAKVLYQSIEYHLLANHIIANAKALYFAGAFFRDSEADNWLTKGLDILNEQIEEQVLADGGHFERSPMYHAIILEDILDIINIGRTFGSNLPKNTKSKAVSMMRWLDHMTHPDGHLAFFNDTTHGIAPLYVALRDYAARLAIVAEPTVQQGLTRFLESGYIRYQHDEVAIIVDIGEVGPDYQSGHAHCDCLSFELSIGNKRYLVNSGISTYNANERRILERATAAHNTVSIDGTEQSEIWSAFRVGRRARPIEVDVGKTRIQAAHDGFRHRGIIHRRHFEFFDDRLEILDVLESNSATSGVAHFHFHPDTNPIIHENTIDVDGLSLTVDNASAFDLTSYEYCAGFNKRRPAKKISVTFESTLMTSISYANTFHK